MGCRRTAEQEALVRVVVADGMFVLDWTRRLPGRGAYLHRDPDCVGRALRTRGVQRTLKVAASPSPQLAEALAPLAASGDV